MPKFKPGDRVVRKPDRKGRYWASKVGGSRMDSIFTVERTEFNAVFLAEVEDLFDESNFDYAPPLDEQLAAAKAEVERLEGLKLAEKLAFPQPGETWRFNSKNGWTQDWKMWGMEDDHYIMSRIVPQGAGRGVKVLTASYHKNEFLKDRWTKC